MIMNMFTERVQSRAEKRDVTRRVVLAAAETLFREQGFAATTVRQIASAASVSVGTVMAVGDKDALLVAVFDDWIAGVHRERREASPQDELDAPSAVTAVLELFAPFVAYFVQDQDLSREYAAVIVRGRHESEIFEGLAVALVSELEDTFRRAGLDAADAGRGARVVYFAYLGLLLTAGNSATVGGSEVDQLREVIELVLDRSNG
ncbi:transcriptional regulator, TetR family [Rhodococcus rhodochrous J3]|uniref:Transcriptional regulator, TetR family n=2 Tax=Rhodococcus rhodochrous TaxID=1829 RepID=A0ABY1M5N7_RHORH|nr:transcriptional regulator, TetR family [Rhodococcus rhodochrous J3]